MREPKAIEKGRAAHLRHPQPLAFACLAALLASTIVAFAQTPATSPGKHRPRAGHPAVNTAADAPQAAPAAPEQPKWPANEAPAQPTVTFNSQGLQIKAHNATLKQILDQVSTKTGAKIEGLGKDERVFGDYGPGQAKDVLAQLLHGSGYDYLMLGDEGQGAPRTLILSARQNSATPKQNVQATPDQQPDDEAPVEQDNDDADQQPVQVIQQPPPPQQPQPVNPQDSMTPQQRMQLMQQQRLQQMQQMQRQYQQQQQQQPQEQPQ